MLSVLNIGKSYENNILFQNLPLNLMSGKRIPLIGLIGPSRALQAGGQGFEYPQPHY